jgi:orotate phosphoribosyltransferase
MAAFRIAHSASLLSYSPAEMLDLDELLRKSGALLTGHYRLSSGLHSPNYVQCARLLEDPNDARDLGAALAEKLREFAAERIVAPALGGVVIGFTVAQALDRPMIFTERKDGAMTLRRGFTIGEAKHVVIVEDVVTTGKSTNETAEVVRQHGGEVIGFASILNRSRQENPFPLPYVFLKQMSLETYREEECPLCKSGVPLDAPGSRFTGR